MSWEEEIEELRRREALARRMGGPQKVKRQHDGGKLTVRERIERLLDAGSFHEVGALAGVAKYGADGALADFTPANLVIGRGRIEGRPVAVAGDDFTVRGGANDGGIREKLLAVERMAADLRLPLVRLVDGTGGGGSVKNLELHGHSPMPKAFLWDWWTENLSAVPVVSLALGSVAGLGAARVVASHYSVMVKGSSQMFVAGPPVVEWTHGRFEKNELGGSHIHTRNGAVDDEAQSEDDAFARARRFLSYLPSSVHELAARMPNEDDPGRSDAWLLEAVPRDPRKTYAMRRIIDAVADRGSFFETGRLWGRTIITGFARLAGWPVALMAGDSMQYGGAWTARASEKITRFVDLAQTFHLPVVHLVDCPGFLIGPQAEQEGTIRAGMRAASAILQSTVPWCSVIVRKVFGVAGALHQNSSRYCVRVAWPSAEWGSLPIAGGLEAAYKAEIEAAPDPAAKRAEIEGRIRRFASPLRSAERYDIEEIIDPRDTRRLLCEFAELAAPLRTPGRSWFGVRP
ncbi:MAG: methylmalonyl-CoA carboxyltransferase [Betaproteobacteria bacterium]|nr:methylmalonyl-CoA carboxyltransferase [Betaproteobacteria bacterium]